ncbi:MAG: PEP/pyruvate-binding domain-containing protein [Candidatus Bruticola sp.]
MHSMGKFYELASYRVREVLFVSSEYDAFILETENQLAERLFYRYSEFFMVGVPRISHASSAERAIEILDSHRVDLIVVAVRDAAMIRTGFLLRIRKLHPSIPVILLILDLSCLHGLGWEKLPKWLAGVYLWTGDLSLITAMFNQIEDCFNAERDTSSIGVQVIITVEDTVADYSVFLPHLYDELFEQSRSLSGEGVNSTQRTLRMLARPKILLASDYESAQSLFDKYQRYVFALISDVSFRVKGKLDDQAGIRLATYCSERKPNLPILLQSSDSSNEQRAVSQGWHFANKKPKTFRPALHLFLEESLGFGNFVFRMPDRTEVARARDTYELERILHTVDLRSFSYHAINNHFSIWLRARNYFNLANVVENMKMEDGASLEEMRRRLISVLQDSAREERQGVIADFSVHRSGNSSHNFFRVGKGSIGGKGRGIAFINSLLAKENFITEWPNLKVTIPRTLALGVDVYDRFMELNKFSLDEQRNHSDEELVDIYLNAELPQEIFDELREAASLLHGPLAVRSSSLLEDSQNQSCAGIYATYMIPDNHENSPKRFELICQAVKRVYMSAVSSKARAYLANAQYLGVEEKMAVILQETVGSAHGRYFYPNFSGVALSVNYYPMGPQHIDDGIVAMAVGLGNTVADGGSCMRFSPKWPKVLPHLYYQDRYLNYSQRDFYAIELNGSTYENPSGLVRLKLKQAEEDGTLAPVASVFSVESGTWRDSLEYVGPRAVTFSDILQSEHIPLAKCLDELLERFNVAIGCPVELEFAVELGPNFVSRNDFLCSEQSDPAELGSVIPTLYILQLRPLTRLSVGEEIRACGYSKDNILCTSDSLGHGVIDDICDIVYVSGYNLSAREARLAAARVARFNSTLIKEKRPYILIGPGRWGSLDPNLGIPVQISQVMGAGVIVELPYGDRFVEPSMGSHFFHELAAMHICYMNLCFKGSGHAFSKGGRTGDCREDQDVQCADKIMPDYIDLDWLSSLPVLHEVDGVKHIRLDSPLHVRVNGRCCRGVVLKNQINSAVETDEKLSHSASSLSSAIW